MAFSWTLGTEDWAEEPDGMDEWTQPKYDSLPDFHLRNPLKDIHGEILSFENRTSGLPKRKRVCLENLERYASVGSAGDHITLFLNIQKLTRFDDDLSDMRDISELCIERLKLDEAYNTLLFTNMRLQDFENVLTEVDEDALITMRNCQQIILIMNALSSRRPVPIKFEGLTERGVTSLHTSTGGVLLISGSYIGIIDNPTASETEKSKHQSMTVYDGDWMRCASDIATQRCILKISCQLGNKFNSYHYPDENFLNLIFAWGDKVLRQFGNNGFKLIKAYEALCAGFIMTLSDDIVADRTKFYRNTRHDLITEDPSYMPYLVELNEILEKATSIHWLSQVYGLHRVWGHPLVDSLKGMEKVIVIGRKDIVLSNRLPNRINDHFKQMFVSGFRAKHKSYPPMTISEGQETMKLKLETNDPSLMDDLNNHPELWEEITLNQCFQLPETFNLSMVVADKSVSPTRKELVKNIRKRKTVMNAELRRGVLRWLNETSIDPREFLMQVDRGEFPDDHKIIGLTPKERELNPTPRMFSLMSHLMRVYVVITEAMLSEHVLPLFPQITMTDSLLELSKKIYSNVRGLQSNTVRKTKVAKRTICYSLDFEKWNGHMRLSSTGPLFESLGRIFGLPNLFKQTYKIFEESYYYLADGSYVPTFKKNGELIVEEPNSFTGHKGGMEGLRQKGWTLFTVVGLDLILSRHNCTYQIMGMGDNQVLIVTFYTNQVDDAGIISPKGIQHLKKNMDDLTSDLIDTFGDLGLPLKPLETWTSESLFLYGKYPFFKGVPLTMDLKRIMRSFPFSNDDIMTTENILNTIAGNATSAAQNAPFIGVSYIMGMYMLSMAVVDLHHYHPLLGKGLTSALCQELSKKDPCWIMKGNGEGPTTYSIKGKHMRPLHVYLLMMTIPKTLGGYVTYHLPTMLMRGFPDPVTRDLYCMRTLMSNIFLQGSELLERLNNWACPIWMPKKNLRLLLEDILSLNLLKPVTPIAEVRQSVTNFLAKSGKVTNTEFKDLMSVKNGEIEDLLAGFLCKGEKLHIRLLHDIYESSIIGYIDSIVSKVTKTSTIQRLSMSQSRKDVSLSLASTEINYYLYFYWRSDCRGETWESQCETSVARQFRYSGWNKIIKGVTVPFPLSFMGRTNCFTRGRQLCKCNEGFVSTHFSDSVLSPEMWEHELGNGEPYMGSITKEKVTVQSGSKIYTSEPLVRRPVQLLRTINWFVPEDSNCAKTITACLNAVTNVNPDQFKGVAEGTSGAEEHRYRDTSLTHGTLTMSNFLYSSRFHISTDNLYKYSRGGKNCDLHFQALLCAITEISNVYVAVMNQTGDKIERAQHWREECPECIRELDETFEDLPDDVSSALIPSRRTNKYLYVDQARISYIEDYRPYKRLIKDYINPEVFMKLTNTHKYYLLLDSLGDYIAEMIFKSEESADRHRISLHSGTMLNRLIYTKLDASDLFLNVAHKIRMLAEFRILQSKEAGTLVSPEKLSNIIEKTLLNADSGSFLGLALFFSWSSLMKLGTYSWYIPPDTIPVTIESACVSIRHSLLSFLRSNTVTISRPTSLIIEELKDSGNSYKLIMVNKLDRIENRCEDCLTSLKGFPHFKLASKAINIVCGKGHNVLERYQLSVPVIRCTVDRLRKECGEINKQPSDYPGVMSRIHPMKFHSIVEIMNSSRLRRKFRNADESYMCELQKKSQILGEKCFHISVNDISKIITKPTSAKYKYLDLLTYILRDKNQSRRPIFVTGDGIGHTSEIIHRLTQRRVIVSTLLDSESAIPQTMPNLFCDYNTNGAIDKVTMIHNTNNILSPNWTEDWKSVVEDVPEIWSDIELLGPGRYMDRQSNVRKLLELSEWTRAVIKDYIYNRRELEMRIGLIIKYTSQYKLMTSSLRQKGHPECWWIIHNSSGTLYNDNQRIYILYEDRVMRDIWHSYEVKMTVEPNSFDATVDEANRTLVSKTEYVKMLNMAKNWCSLDYCGCLIPQDGKDFTSILGKLQSGRRPQSARDVGDKGQLKLYNSNWEDLRIRLLTIACAMLAHGQDRINFLHESPRWNLAFDTKQGRTTWYPYLKREQHKIGDGVNNDFVAVLAIHMKRLKMSFRRYVETIEFAYVRKRRDTLSFPVAKNMIIRIKN
ncbi:RNA-dependent RNA polymerase [Actinidia cytorhabdovirus JS27]|uniref:Replicase n=1 Tax=Actinidia virus D TaxID=3069721 RepID=A0A8E7DAA3_9RHAB|nr:RNA-dependent RNA polymerase [Actinidia cytorhabdovirus JS27]QVU21449.1 RNA-dependent RNA polymerase [Actinidia virus D]